MSATKSDSLESGNKPFQASAPSVLVSLPIGLVNRYLVPGVGLLKPLLGPTLSGSIIAFTGSISFVGVVSASIVTNRILSSVGCKATVPTTSVPFSSV